MTHLIVCREYPPAPFPPGGIGTYVRHIARLLAEAGETVHVIAQRWAGAPSPIVESCGGKLIVHRVSPDEPVGASDDAALLRRLANSDCPSQPFSWQTARLVESLVESEGIDVIEAQEWEAPLYYFQVRRAMGLGPRREPPCLIHLHSPSKLIFRHNEWDETLTDFLPLSQLEDHTVRAADALLCPSRYLAHGAAELFGFSPADVEIIPYPRGDSDIIERSPEVWKGNAICYVGRLELRKGVVEWIDAAVEVAGNDLSVTFDFVGGDTSLSGGVGGFVGEHLSRRIPAAFRRRFRFHGAQSREYVHRMLARASVVVVPSRWENLPYTCIEAMSTGAPVLASPNGGMAELIDDGESGWIAPEATASGFKTGLLRVLSTSPEERAKMGRAAAAAVRRICDNSLVLGRHLEMRDRLVRAAPRRTPANPGSRGIGFVISCSVAPGPDSASAIAGCIESIRGQTPPPQTTIVVANEHYRGTLDAIDVPVIYAPHQPLEEARDVGVRALGPLSELSSIAFIDACARVEPPLSMLCKSLFSRAPEIGLISGGDELITCHVFRTEALLRYGTTAIAHRSVRYPLVVGVEPSGLAPKERVVQRRYSVVALAQAGSAQFALKWFLALPRRDKVRWLTKILLSPGVTARKLVWAVRKFMA